MPETYDVEVRGNTYPLKKMLVECGLWWDPTKRAWIAWQVERENLTKIARLCHVYGLPIKVKTLGAAVQKHVPRLHPGQMALTDYAAQGTA